MFPHDCITFWSAVDHAFCWPQLFTPLMCTYYPSRSSWLLQQDSLYIASHSFFHSRLRRMLPGTRSVQIENGVAKLTFHYYMHQRTKIYKSMTTCPTFSFEAPLRATCTLSAVTSILSTLWGDIGTHFSHSPYNTTSTMALSLLQKYV